MDCGPKRRTKMIDWNHSFNKKEMCAGKEGGGN
jgi:hypothetical protein